MSEPTDEKIPVDFGRMLEIKSALWALENSKAYYENDFWEAISPLLTALKKNEHDQIVYALSKRSMGQGEKMKMQIIAFIYYFISEPRHVLGFDLDKLTKTDVLQVIKDGFPVYFACMPESQRGLSNWWKSIEPGLNRAGIFIGQGRGDAHPDLEKWIETRKRRITSREITFTPSGEPMENGRLMFLDFANDLTPNF